jgi:adenylate cyclase class IV
MARHPEMVRHPEMARHPEMVRHPERSEGSPLPLSSDSPARSRASLGMTGMSVELEVKAVIPDLEALRARLLAAGATPRFRGRMSDWRYDRPGGELSLRDQVLRVRAFHHPGGRTASVIAWKGPVERSADGYKRRGEIELPVTGTEAASPHALLSALGYVVVHAIDREVELFDLAAATVRTEQYPRMDALLEIEGEPAAIERAIRATGIPRADFTADSLADFVRRFELRTGQGALLALP